MTHESGDIPSRKQKGTLEKCYKIKGLYRPKESGTRKFFERVDYFRQVLSSLRRRQVLLSRFPH